MIKPEVTDSDQALMFSFMDRDRSGGITRKEFVLHSCDALRFDFAKWRRHERTKHRASGFLCCYDVVISGPHAAARADAPTSPAVEQADAEVPLW